MVLSSNVIFSNPAATERSFAPVGGGRGCCPRLSFGFCSASLGRANDSLVSVLLLSVSDAEDGVSAPPAEVADVNEPLLLLNPLLLLLLPLAALVLDTPLPPIGGVGAVAKRNLQSRRWKPWFARSLRLWDDGRHDVCLEFERRTSAGSVTCPASV